MEVDLFLKTIFLPQLDDSNPDSDEVVADPVRKFLEQVELDILSKDARAVADASWDEPLSGPVVQKNPAPLLFARGTRGFKLGITRQEEKLLDGEKWIHSFNAAGELVAADLIDS